MQTLIIIIIMNSNNKLAADHKDPFHGIFKATMVGFVLFLQLVPWMALCPWLPFLYYYEAQTSNTRIQENWLKVQMSYLGCLVLVTYQFGAFLARLAPGFSMIITKESSKEGTPPRMLLTIGIMMQIPFYAVLYFMTDELIIFGFTTD
jgi:hypothetical protein